MRLTVIEGRYLEDLLEQPRAIRATWEALRAGSAIENVQRLTSGRRLQRLVLTGMGSSYFALHPLALETAEHGWTPVMLETSELVHYYPRLLEGALVVVVSQSGRSAETIRLLTQVGGNQTVIAVTNTPDSPLARRADVSLVTEAGDEFSVSCKTYVSALVALSTLSAALCGIDVAARLAELESAADRASAYLSSWREHVEELGVELRGARHLFLVGRGASLAAAGTGALIIKESDHFHAEGMSSAAFRHGPLEMVTPESFVGVFAGDERTRELNERLASDAREHGARSALVGKESSLRSCRLHDVPPAVRPVVELLPVEMMTLALAALSNREAGKFERATKVTVVE